eukprot:TRINITY_DN683_c5_g1_i1.p1 TRINITY_DN683_c5_g1~~TRINITY_DN683_c5_g1_i1.p1  ORF type:complete len:472 (-),score=105.84 TRINITY_DN683_c5_g1_i1:78-1493(-)
MAETESARMPSKLTDVTFHGYLMIAGGCAAAAICISLVHLIRHSLYNKGSEAIRYCVYRIVLMVPLYAVNAAMCLYLTTDKNQIAELITIGREFYESFVIVAFVQLLLLTLGGPVAVAEAFSRVMQEPEHVWITIFKKLNMDVHWIFRLLPMPYSPGTSLVAGVLSGILQFSFVTWFACACEAAIWSTTVTLAHLDYCSYEECFANMRLFIKVPNMFKNMSVAWAMYNLFLLFLEIERNDELRDKFESIKPEGKFICVKAIIGLTAFQKVLCENVLPHFHIFDKYHEYSVAHGADWTTEQIGSGVQNFILCVELLIIALWHLWAYPVHDYKEEVGGKDKWVVGTCAMLREVRDLRIKAGDQLKTMRRLGNNDGGVDDELVQRAFEAFDVDNSGTLTSLEFSYVLKSLGHRSDDIKRFLKTVDKDGNGFITKMEFTKGMMRVNDELPPLVSGGGSAKGGLGARLLGSRGGEP